MKLLRIVSQKERKKIADLEESSHQNNQGFDGFQEETTETCGENESIITDFVKEKLGIEEDILIERAHRAVKIQRNDGTRNRKRAIVVKFPNFKDKSRILHNYREKKLWKEKVFVNKDFSELTASIEGLLQKQKIFDWRTRLQRLYMINQLFMKTREEMIFLKYKTILKLPSS